MPKKLEISVSEMRYMRDQGMTNSDIANAVGCSVATVMRYLKGYGKAPRRYVRHDTEMKPREEEVDAFASVRGILNGEEPMPVTHAAPVGPVVRAEPERVTDKLAGLDIMSKVLTIRGSHCVYEVDVMAGGIIMRDGDVTGILDRDGVQAVCRELMRLYNVMEG